MSTITVPDIPLDTAGTGRGRRGLRPAPGRRPAAAGPALRPGRLPAGGPGPVRRRLGLPVGRAARLPDALEPGPLPAGAGAGRSAVRGGGAAGRAGVRGG